MDREEILNLCNDLDFDGHTEFEKLSPKKKLLWLSNTAYFVNKVKKQKVKQVKIFSCFEEENEYETQRQKKMTSKERFEEFAVLQERIWGPGWSEKKISLTVAVDEEFFK